MTQTASRSRFRFIPQLIEQQLATYQTGEPLDLYQWGWIRKPTGDKTSISPKLGGFLFTSIGLAAIIGAAYAINDAVTTTYIPATAIALILTVPILLLLFGVIFFFQSSPFCVIAFRDYFVFAKKKHVIVLHWHEIASCERKTIVHSWPANQLSNTHKYTIRTHDGRKLSWKVAEHVMEDLGNIISDRIG